MRDAPERPIFGHGVGMFEDNTPEARLMGVEGQRTYPHNSLVEAAYSLGALGLVAYIAFVGWPQPRRSRSAVDDPAAIKRSP